MNQRWLDGMKGWSGRFFAIIMAFVMVSVLPVGLIGGNSANTNPIVVETDKGTYMPGESVLITVTNAGNETLSGTPSAAIYDEYGTVVFSWVFTEVIEEWSPGYTMTLEWDQNDNFGRPVPPGMYFAWASFGGYEGEAKFTIEDPNHGGFVHITSPNGGEIFDDLVSIEWDFGAPDVDILGAGWNFDLYYAHGLDMPPWEYPPEAWIHIDTLYYNPSANPDTQEYPSPYIWHTGDLPEGEYVVRVVGTYADYTLEDVGDGPFTIAHASQPPMVWIDDFKSDRDVYNVGDMAVLNVVVARGNDALAMVFEGVCVIYYGPVDGNYIEGRYELRFEIPSPDTSVTLTQDIVISMPSDYYAVAEIYDANDYCPDAAESNDGAYRCGPLDSAKIYIAVTDNGSHNGVVVQSPNDGDVVSGMVRIMWETYLDGARTNEGLVDITLIPIYLFDEPWAEPLEGYYASEPTMDTDGDGLPDDSDPDPYDPTVPGLENGSGGSRGDIDGDGIPDESDPDAEDASVIGENISDLGEGYVIASGIENTGSYEWDSSEVNNYAYVIVITVTMDTGEVLRGESGAFFVMNNVEIEPPNASIMLFYTDKNEYMVGEEMMATAVIARENYEPTEIDGFITMYVSDEMGNILFRDEEYFYIAPTGEYATVIFAPYVLNTQGVLWVTATLSDEVPLPAPEPMPEPMPMPPATSESGPGGGISGGAEGTNGGSEDYYVDDTGNMVYPYYDWYGPQTITIPIIVYGDGGGEWHIELERPVDGDVMHRMDYIMWTFDGPYGFGFGDEPLEDWGADVPPDWYWDECGGGMPILPQDSDGDGYGEEENDPGMPVNDGDVEVDEGQEMPGEDGGGEVPPMPGPGPEPEPNPRPEYGNLFVRIEYRPLDIMPLGGENMGERNVPGEPGDVENVPTNNMGEGWMLLGIVNANLHILPWDTYGLPNGPYEMRITLFQYDYDFEAMEENSGIANSEMPERYVIGMHALSEDISSFFIYNDVPTEGPDPWDPYLNEVYNTTALLGEAFAYEGASEPTLYASGVSINISYDMGAVEITVSAEMEGGRIVVINIDPERLNLTAADLGDVLKALEVEFDSEGIATGSIEDVLNASSNAATEPVYAALVTMIGADGSKDYNIKLVVYIPHFSTHRIVVRRATSRESDNGGGWDVLGNSSAAYVGIFGLGLAVGIVVLLSALYIKDRERLKDTTTAKNMSTMADVQPEEDKKDEEDKWIRLFE